VRILFLTRSYNSLTQALHVALARAGHEVSVEFDIAAAVTEEAVALFTPDLIVAPFMKRAIPASVWQRHVCLVVHPGPLGDRGPSALDWALQQRASRWGVTVLQAEAEMDAGPVWAHREFALRAGTKSSVYRREVTAAAVAAVLEAVQRFAAGGFVPQRAPAECVVTRPLLRQDARRIDWARDDTATVLAKLRAADGVPGVLDQLFGVPCHLFDARPAAPADELRGFPGSLLARRQHAVARATVDGAVWIGHARRAAAPDAAAAAAAAGTAGTAVTAVTAATAATAATADTAAAAAAAAAVATADADADAGAAFKLPVALAFPREWAALPALPGDDEIRYEQHGAVGVLHFDFYNGAMSTAQCERLLAAYRAALAQPARVLMLAGGRDFFSNGIHLNVIEAAASAADESWRNINAMDDLCEAILTTTDRPVVAALQGNAGAGGAFLALTADQVWARAGVLLNPHYKNMGNLYGSEYWTYTLPRRVKRGEPRAVMHNRLPIDAEQARELGLVDTVLEGDPARFLAAAIERAQQLAADLGWAAQVQAKAAARARDEAARPLARYREEELAQMRRNFYGFDSSYHVARSYFVRKTLPSWTPRHLARHRAGAAPRRAA
jgi:putative two-component system hydrogenase maturation factor HypX/HoxX